MKNFLLAFMLIFMTSAFSKTVVVSTGTDLLEAVNFNKSTVNVVDKYERTSVLELDDKNFGPIIEAAHKARRCGGFFVHENLEEARRFIRTVNRTNELTPRKAFPITNPVLVKNLINKVQEPRILKTILDLSAFQNRFYKGEHGVKSMTYLKDSWNKFAPTSFFKHKAYPQPSVIATIKGSTYPDEVIIIGGHGDSISGYFGGSNVKAPGADDNASGTATVTEVLRVLTEANFKPLRTIMFMAYAAEEVGLRGSNEIAKDFKARGVNVIGVMQLDMTNFKGSDKTIHLVTDYTDAGQTKFLARLIDTYLKVPYSTTACGYACSDHASWNKAGFPAVFPFEAGKGDMNKKIHTKGDVIGVSGGTALHATNFARLGVAYIIELDSQGSNVRLQKR